LKAIVLAGGRGMRLRPLTRIIPKPLLPIHDKPLLEYIIRTLSENGIKDVIISTSENFREIPFYFGDGKSFGCSIDYVFENERLGGVGAIRYAVEEAGIKDSFFLILGDNLTEIDFRKMWRFHGRKKGIATIALVKSEKPWLYGVVKLDEDDRIIEFIEKPKKEKGALEYVSTGIYIFEPRVIDYINPKKFMDSTGMLFPILLKSGERIYGYKSDRFWLDVGNFEDYRRAWQWASRKILRRY
jgi:NDP-sugar pyrophosphorylase family protein